MEYKTAIKWMGRWIQEQLMNNMLENTLSEPRPGSFILEDHFTEIDFGVISNTHRETPRHTHLGKKNLQLKISGMPDRMAARNVK